MPKAEGGAHKGPRMQVVVALAGEIHDSPLVRNALNSAGLIIAADSGANRLRQLGLLPHVVIGDLDSLQGDDLFNLKAVGVEFEPHPDPEQRTDGDVAIEYALKRGATSIIVVGLFGWPPLRPRGVANLYLLTHPSLRRPDPHLDRRRLDRPVTVLNGIAVLTAVHKRVETGPLPRTDRRLRHSSLGRTQRCNWNQVVEGLHHSITTVGGAQTAVAPRQRHGDFHG